MTVAAALLDEPFGSAQDLLDELVSAHLIEITDDHYCFRTLVCLFARERLAAEEPASSREAALERLLGVRPDLAAATRRLQCGKEYLRPGNAAARWPLSGQSAATRARRS